MSLHPDIERVALLGWCVYPCSTTSRAGLFKGAHLAATSDLNQLARWSREYPRSNWRVVFGPSRLWGLDLDVPSATHTHGYNGITSLASLVTLHGPIPPRPQARSGGGGLGLYFAWTGERIRGESNVPAGGIDPRRGAQSQTIPPSVHVVTRKPYRWLTAPWEVAPPIGPTWLLKLLQPPPEPMWRRAPVDTSDDARRRLYRAAMAVMDAPPGDRNNTLNRRAYQIGRMINAGLIAEKEAVDALYGAARSCGLDHGEARDTIHSGIRSGIRSPVPANG